MRKEVREFPYRSDVVVGRAVNIIEGTFHEVITWEEFISDLNPKEFQILHIAKEA